MNNNKNYAKQDSFYIKKGMSMMPYQEFAHLVSPLWFRANKGSFTHHGHPRRVCTTIVKQLSYTRHAN